MMRKFLVVVLVLACSQIALALQNFEFRSTSGKTVRMVGTENMNFQIQLYSPNGQVATADARWIQVKQSFRYTTGGQSYIGNWLPGGRSIEITSPDGTRTRWDFVRIISR